MGTTLESRIAALERVQGRELDATAARIIQDATATGSGLEVFDEMWERLPGESDATLKQRVTVAILQLPGRTLTQMVMSEYAKAMFVKEHGRGEGESQVDFENRVLKKRKELLNLEKESKVRWQNEYQTKKS